MRAKKGRLNRKRIDQRRTPVDRGTMEFNITDTRTGQVHQLKVPGMTLDEFERKFWRFLPPGRGGK